jgi:hypothetical protein
MKVFLERYSWPHWTTALMLAGLLVSAMQSAWAGPHDHEPQTLKGVVERFNYRPKGGYESVLIESADKLAQVNFPPHMAAEVAKAVATGDQISVVAVAGKSKGDHSVYRLQKFTTAKGEEIVMLKPKPGEQPPPGEQPKPGNVGKIEGVVKYLNYARHGEVNGAVLESGDFVHLGPHGAELVKPAIGQKLSVEGAAATMADGHLVIEHPSAVNDVKIR